MFGESVQHFLVGLCERWISQYVQAGLDNVRVSELRILTDDFGVLRLDQLSARQPAENRGWLIGLPVHPRGKFIADAFLPKNFVDCIDRLRASRSVRPAFEPNLNVV